METYLTRYPGSNIVHDMVPDFRIQYVTYVFNKEGLVPNPRAKTNHTDGIGTGQ